MHYKTIYIYILNIIKYIIILKRKNDFFSELSDSYNKVPREIAKKLGIKKILFFA